MGGIELAPGLRPGGPVGAQRGLAQGVGHGGGRPQGGWRLQRSRAADPEAVDRPQAAGGARIVHRVRVEQHLCFALQALEQLAAGRIGGTLGHPAVHRAAAHAVQAGAGDVAQRFAAGVPARGALKAQGDAVFRTVGCKCVEQVAGVFIGQANLLARQQAHVVRADLEMAGAEPGLWRGGLVAVRGRPRNLTVVAGRSVRLHQPSRPRQRALVRQAQAVVVTAVGGLGRQFGQQGLQVRQAQAAKHRQALRRTGAGKRDQQAVGQWGRGF
ncbi:hypothetical protein FQZ97_838200 [compost metagenome]